VIERFANRCMGTEAALAPRFRAQGFQIEIGLFAILIRRRSPRSALINPTSPSTATLRFAQDAPSPNN
jgi:hypothetical protein